MKTLRVALPASIGQSRYELVAWEFGEEGPLAYLQAGLHADEMPGVLVLHRLRQALVTLEAEGALLGRIRLVPLANPIGLNQCSFGYHQGRFELGSGRNFNRGYPRLTHSEEQAVNLEQARRLLQLRLMQQLPANELEWLQHTLFGWAIDADLVLDLHCDSAAVLHLYGSSWQCEALESMGRRLGAEAILVAEVAGGMSFDDALMQNWFSLLGEAHWPVPLAATVELRGQHDLDEATTQEDTQRLLDLLTERGWLRRELTTLLTPLVAATPLSAVEVIQAPCGGIIQYRVMPGQWVSAGELLALLTEPDCGRCVPIYSQGRGLCYARRLGPLVHAGEEMLFIAGETVQRSGNLLSP